MGVGGGEERGQRLRWRPSVVKVSGYAKAAVEGRRRVAGASAKAPALQSVPSTAAVCIQMISQLIAHTGCHTRRAALPLPDSANLRCCRTPAGGGAAENIKNVRKGSGL